MAPTTGAEYAPPMPRLTQRTARTIAVGAVSVGILVSAMPAAVHADDEPRVESIEGIDGTVSDSQGPVRGSDDLFAATTRVGWGWYRVNGSFASIQVAPSRQAVVAIDRDAGRLMRYDVETNEITYGVSVNSANAAVLTVSPDGTWVYLATEATSPNIARFSLDTLQFDRVIDIAALFAPGETAEPINSLTTVSGNENRLVVSAGDHIGVFDDANLIAKASFPGEQSLNSLIVVDDQYGYGIENGTGSLWAFTLGSDGSLTSPVVAPQGFDVRSPLQAVGNELLGVNALFSVPDLVARTPRPAELAQRDPVLPIAFESVDVEGPTSRVETTIYDAVTLDEITSGANCMPIGWVLVGGGIFVDSIATAGIEFIDAIDRCSGYGEFQAIEPARILDTRDGSGGNGVVGRRSAGSTTRVKVQGLGGVPDQGVSSVVLNVTAVNQLDDPDGSNFVTVWPAGLEMPTVSSLNVANGRTVGNQVTVASDEDGYVNVYSDAGSIHLTVDVLGYFGSGLSARGARYVPMPNVRLVDTRDGGGVLGPGQTTDIRIPEYRDVPNLAGSDVVAAIVNVTAIGSSERGFIQTYPGGGRVPSSSSMNFEPQTNTARLVTVATGEGDIVTLRNDVGSTHVAVDIVGVYIIPIDARETDGPVRQTGRFVGIDPFRFSDTRESSPFDGDGRLEPDSFVIYGADQRFQLLTNLTAVQTEEVGFLSAGPWREPGDHLLRTSSLNYRENSIVANQTIIQPSDDNEIGVYSSSAAHVLIDVFGYYT
jgi:hypothetical protein